MSRSRFLFNFKFSDKHASAVGLMLVVSLLFINIDSMAHHDIDFFDFSRVSNRIAYAFYASMFAFFTLNFSTLTLTMRKIGIVSLVVLQAFYYYVYYTDRDRVYFDRHFLNDYGAMFALVVFCMVLAVSLNLLIRALEFMFGLFGRAGE